MDYLNELFALPIGLTNVITIDDIPLYGSKSLKEKFIESLHGAKRGKLIFKTVVRMVNQEQIIPCFSESNVFSHFRKRISQDTSGGLLRLLRYIVFAKNPINSPLDNAFAFYDLNRNKIIVLINNHIEDKFSVTASNNSIALCLTHEMMHMFAHQNPNKFLSLFKDELNSYYLNYFKIIFNLNDEKSLENSIEEIYKFLFIRIERSTASTISLNSIYKQLNKLKKYSNLDNDKFDTICMDYVRVIKLMMVYSDDVSKIIPIIKEKYRHIAIPLYDSYKISFGRIPSKGCLQELVYPSEVVCGYSDIRLDSKVKTALNSIK